MHCEILELQLSTLLVWYVLVVALLNWPLRPSIPSWGSWGWAWGTRWPPRGSHQSRLLPHTENEAFKRILLIILLLCKIMIGHFEILNNNL